MSVVAATRRRVATLDRRTVAGAFFAALGALDILGFGLGAHAGDAVFRFSVGGESAHVPDLSLPAGTTAIVLGSLSVALGALYAGWQLGRTARRVVIAAVMALFILALLCWVDAGNSPLNIVGLLQSSLTRSIPLVLGAMSGLLGERAAVINIAIEGQLLIGAFAAAVAASAAGMLWLGLISGSLAGGLIGVLLAVFAIRYLVDQIVLGVVLNVFVLGLTGYLYDRALVPYQTTLNSPGVYGTIRVPGLADIPIIGPIFFDSNVFLYITYAVLLLVQVGVFHTRWGLRVRAVGEHPVAAETVGIRVIYTRYRQLVLGGLIAGIGGAYLTIGSVGAFGKGMSSGQGYIALAAMIFGRWTPFGAVGAALLFGFASALQNILSILGAPIPSDILLMTPYLVVILVVAGLVGRVRMPAADGKPYIKS